MTGSADEAKVLAAINRISLEVSRQIAETANGVGLETPPATLYHYTPQTAARDILANGVLWATHTEYLNDSQELRHIQRPLEGAWKRLWLTMKPGQRVAMQAIEPTLLGAVTPTRNNGLKGPVSSAERYVACFCEQPDLLSQWRGYGGAGPAYAIGFESSKLTQLRPLTPVPQPPRTSPFQTATLVKIEYDTETQVETLYGLLRPTIVSINEVLSTQEATPKDFMRGLGNMGLILRWFIMKTFGARYKDYGFHQEEEWRLIVESHSKDDQLLAYHFRPTALGLAPYLQLAHIDWPVTPEGNYTGQTKRRKLPVTEVTQGPIENADPGLRSMTMALRQKSYEHNGEPVEVEKSKIPYRPT